MDFQTREIQVLRQRVGTRSGLMIMISHSDFSKIDIALPRIVSSDPLHGAPSSQESLDTLGLSGTPISLLYHGSSPQVWVLY